MSEDLPLPGAAVEPDSRARAEVAGSFTYSQVKEKAIALKQLYAENSVELPPTCGLSLLIADAIQVSDLWATGKEREITTGQLFQPVQLNRIADSLVSFDGIRYRSRYLQDFTSGSLSPFDRAHSMAKDILWEMELTAMLKRMSLRAALEEPPDIVVDINGARIGIACKKVYSTRNFESVLSRGVAQVTKASEFGIIAVNLDDLLAPDTIRTAPSRALISASLAQEYATFFADQERHFRKYLSSGRVLGALVSVGGIANIYQEDPALCTVRESLLWVIPGLSAEKAAVIYAFRDQLRG